MSNSNVSNRTAPVPSSIHDQHMLPEGTSFSKRDYHYVGNKEQKTYVHGGIEIYEDGDKEDQTIKGG